MSAIDEALNEHGLKKNKESSGANDGLTATDITKLYAQGFTFNFSDEIIAGAKSVFSEKTYDELKKEENKELQEARDKAPIEAFGYEMAGAFTPAFALAPFTAGASLLPTLGRVLVTGGAKTIPKLMGTSALQSGIASVGSQEEVGLGNTLLSASVGAVTSPIVQKGLSFFGNGFKKIIVDPFLRKRQGSVGGDVENELMRILTESSDKKVDVDNIILRVKNGEIIPEMSVELMQTVRLIVNQMTPASPIIEKAIRNRAGTFVKDVFNSLQNDLAPIVKGKATDKGVNVYKTFVNNIGKLKQQKWETYQQIWKLEGGKTLSNLTPDVKTYEDLGGGIVEIVGKSQDNGKIINNFFDRKGLAPLLEATEDGWKLIRNPTLYEGEKVKQAFMNASKRFESGDGPADKDVFINIEKSMKILLDGTNANLQNVRKNWAQIENSIKQYDVGRKLLSPKNDPQEFSVYWDKLKETASKEELDALRMGVAQNLKKRLGESLGRRTSLVNKIADDPLNLESNERQLLQIIYEGLPSGKLEELLKNANLAKGSILAVAKISSGSQTGRQAGDRRIGEVIKNGFRLVNSGGADIDAGRSLIAQLGGDNNKLSDEVMVKVGKILVSTDADLIEKALTDRVARDKLTDKLTKYFQLEGINLGFTRATTLATEKGTSFIDIPQYEDLIIPMIKTLTEPTKKKIIEIAK